MEASFLVVFKVGDEQVASGAQMTKPLPSKFALSFNSERSRNLTATGPEGEVVNVGENRAPKLSG